LFKLETALRLINDPDINVNFIPANAKGCSLSLINDPEVDIIKQNQTKYFLIFQTRNDVGVMVSPPSPPSPFSPIF